MRAVRRRRRVSRPPLNNTLSRFPSNAQAAPRRAAAARRPVYDDPSDDDDGSDFSGGGDDSGSDASDFGGGAKKKGKAAAAAPPPKVKPAAAAKKKAAAAPAPKKPTAPAGPSAPPSEAGDDGGDGDDPADPDGDAPTQATAATGNAPRAIEDVYQKKSQLEHILLRPDTYVGSTERQVVRAWVHDGDGGDGEEGADVAPPSAGMVCRDIGYVPGLYKIFDEILVNAADNRVRDGAMDCLRVDVDASTGWIRVWNNGSGVPVEVHKGEGVYVPELIFGHLLTSSNYNDAEQKVTGGRNGYGAKLANIFSTEFVVETCDGSRRRSYKQVRQRGGGGGESGREGGGMGARARWWPPPPFLFFLSLSPLLVRPPLPPPPSPSTPT